jgi:hypothetical protein
MRATVLAGPTTLFQNEHSGFMTERNSELPSSGGRIETQISAP